MFIDNFLIQTSIGILAIVIISVYTKIRSSKNF